MQYLTNTTFDGVIRKCVMHGSNNPLETPARKEIKLTFKTVIDSVIFPEVETEQEKKLKELEETIKKAQDQIKELQEKN
jgi:hypothetical protein